MEANEKGELSQSSMLTQCLWARSGTQTVDRPLFRMNETARAGRNDIVFQKKPDITVARYTSSGLCSPAVPEDETTWLGPMGSFLPAGSRLGGNERYPLGSRLASSQKARRHWFCACLLATVTVILVKEKLKNRNRVPLVTMPPTETTSLMDPLVGNQNNNDNGDDRLEMGRFKSNETSFVTLPESSSSSSPSSTSLEDNRGNNSRTSAPHYDPDDQWRIIFQLFGSVWPRVAPWCIAVSVFTYVVYALKEHNIVDLTIASNAGHNFMSLLVSFLLVTRATVVYQRFMEARQCLSDLYRNGRELVHHSCIFADHTAVQWRRTVAYKTILTLRMATAALEFRSHKITPWDSLHHEDDQDETPIFMHNNRHHALTELMHGERTTIDESFRAPITWALNLRQCLLKTRKNDNITDLLPVEEMKLLQFCSDMIKSYEGAAKLVRTPMPL